MLEDRDYEKLYGMRAWLRDRVRLAPVFAALFIAIATQVFLVTLGIAIGVITSTTTTGGIAASFATTSVIWFVISGWLSLWLGGWYVAHMSGVAGLMDGILNAVAVWGLYVFSSVLLGGFSALVGIGSLFSVTIGASTVDLLRAINLSSAATLTPAQAAAIRSAVASAAGGVAALTAIGAGFAILGAWLGFRTREVHVTGGRPHQEPPAPRI
jgi:hypothetical protein